MMRVAERGSGGREEARTPCRHAITSHTTDPDPETDAPTPAPPETAEPQARPSWTGRLRGLVTVPRLLLLLLTALAAASYAWSIDTQGLEAYYAAGVRSMSRSRHAFFYDAFDPDASTTLDKLPGAFWVQALSVRLFGYSPWAMVLPQVIESALTVPVLYRAVRRTAGPTAALIAAAVLAASPVTLSSTRGNLSEPLFLLCAVLAADAVLRVVVERRMRSTWTAAAWVALAFQAKMAEAWLLLPALTLALVAGLASRTGTRGRAVARAALLGALAVALSLVWVGFFALTPAADRPVADGSADNSIVEQVFLYNAGFRLGDSTTFSLRPLAPPTPAAKEYAAENLASAHGSGSYPPATFSRPGWDRLLAGGLAPDAAWFTPLALACAAAVLLRRRGAGRGDPVRAATLMWTSWLLTFGVLFSAAQHIHDYYLATLVPAIAALTGIGLVTLRRSPRGRGLVLPALLAGQALWTAFLLSGQAALLRWGVLGVGVLAAAALALIEHHRHPEHPERTRRRAAAGGLLALALTAALAGPVAGCWWLLARAGGAFDTPFAEAGTMARPTRAAVTARLGMHGLYGAVLLARSSPDRWSTLMATGARLQHTADVTHSRILVFGSSEAATYVMSGVTSIEPVGGFTGDLPSPTADQVEQLIRTHRISLAIVPGYDVPSGTDPRVKVVRDLCTPGPHGPEADTLVFTCLR